MWFDSKNNLVKCIDCACCNVKEMKCYPNSVDCHSVYDLDEKDLHTPARCDFFKWKN